MDERSPDKTNFSYVVRRFAENTTCHAPPKILAHRRTPVKIFWGLCFVVGIGVFTFYLISLLSTFLRRDTTTGTELRFSILAFPAVTFCNHNQFKQNKLPPSLDEQLSRFLEQRKHELFGGAKEYAQYYQNFLAGSSEVTDIGNVGSTAEVLVETTSQSADSIFRRQTTQHETPMPPFERKKRSVYGTKKLAKRNTNGQEDGSVGYFNEKELETIKSMEGFFISPRFEQNLENLTWFNNYGTESSENAMLLNITATIQEMEVEELMQYGHSIDEMLQECTFMGQVCGPQDFTQFYSLKYGNCFTFNHGMNGHVSKITSPGKSLGLTMVLFINQGQYSQAMSPDAGVRMMLHKQGQVPLVEEDGFDLEPGTNSGVAVKYVEISRYGPPYSDCTNNMTIYSESGEPYYPGNYTQQLCIKVCLQNAVIAQCGCANPLHRKPPEVATCSNQEDYSCAQQVEIDLLSRDTCVAICPLPCWESQYFHSLSSSQWPSNRFIQYYAESLLARPEFRIALEDDPDEMIRENFVKLTVYYDNLNYYRYTEKPVMTPEDLIGAIGGHLGLWIGMSIISFFELFEVIIHAWSFLIEKFKRSKLGSMNRLSSVTPVQEIHHDKDEKVWLD